MKKKVLVPEEVPEFSQSIAAMPEDSKIFVDKSLEIAEYIFQLLERKGIKQKDLADKMGKSEAEISKLLTGMHNYTLRSIAKIEAALGETIICTPVKAKMSFPLKSGSVIKYEVVEMKEQSAPVGITYNSRVIKMHSTGYETESTAI